MVEKFLLRLYDLARGFLGSALAEANPVSSVRRVSGEFNFLLSCVVCQLDNPGRSNTPTLEGKCLFRKKKRIKSIE